MSAFSEGGCVQSGCTCIGHRVPGVHHVVPCCDEPHVQEDRTTTEQPDGAHDEGDSA